MKSLVTLISQLNLRRSAVILLMITCHLVSAIHQSWWLPRLMIQGFSPSISILFQTWWIICIYLFHVNCELTFFLLIFPLHVSFLVSSSFPSWFDRVGIWEAAKWVAKVRDITCRSCSKSVILKTNMQSGHFGEGGRFMHCDETAFDYAFLMKALRLDDITIA